MESLNYRAVLIGIDDYSRRPLSGCVNDIDQIERILLDRLKVPAERVTRFAAPRSGAASTTRLSSSRPPTRDELRSFLESLAAEVGPDDAVFLYYSGHGSRVTTTVNGQLISREALVPVDYWNESDPQHQRLLYDYELNGLLARISERAGDLTVVLDCCHSASVDRGEGERRVEIEEVQELPPQAFPGGGLAKDASGLASAAATHMLVAACRANESAYEVKPDQDGVWPQQGAFSRALVQILEAVDKPLQELRWWDISVALVERLKSLATDTASRPQNPSIVGHEGRRVFGGPWARRDLGYALSQNGEGFRIGAGTLTGLSKGAEVAVYGAEPDRFPILNSAQDQAARIGLLRVDTAETSSCTAVSVSGGFKLPQGARGRLVRPGEPDLLTVELDPFEIRLAARLATWGIVAALPGEQGSEARLRRENGQLHLGDEVYDRGGQPPLASFSADVPDLTEVVLDHYIRYRQALRLPSHCDLTGVLEVKLLDAPERQISAEDLQAPGFDELPSDGPWRYKVREGDGFVIRIANRAKDPLEVFVLNCAGSGRVEHLGSAQIPAGAMHVLWSSRKLGIPFSPTVATEGAEAVDRLVVVGTTLPDQDLSYLEVDNSFAEVIARFPDREFGTRSLSPLVERWTAEMVTIGIYK